MGLWAVTHRYKHTFALPNMWFGHGVALGSEGVVPKAAFGVAHDAGALGLIEGRAQFLSPYWSHQTMPRRDHRGELIHVEYVVNLWILGRRCHSEAFTIMPTAATPF